MKNNQKNNQYIEYLRNFGYMKDINRADRVKSTQEVFTPISACEYYCSQVEDYSSAFTNIHEKIIDNCVGDGEWVGACLIKRLENGFSLEESLKTIFGTDLQDDNILLARQRLLCGETSLDLIRIVEKNIVYANALEYNYLFGEPDVFGNGLFEVE